MKHSVLYPRTKDASEIESTEKFLLRVARANTSYVFGGDLKKVKIYSDLFAYHGLEFNLGDEWIALETTDIDVVNFVAWSTRSESFIVRNTLHTMHTPRKPMKPLVKKLFNKFVPHMPTPDIGTLCSILGDIT